MDIDSMKQRYMELTKGLLEWITQTIKRLQRNIPTKLDELHEEINQFKLFRTSKKPLK